MRFTHTGYVIGCDSRTSPDYKRVVLLRETKTMFISKCGSRFSKKKNGRVFGIWPKYKLDLDSIVQISSEA